SSTPTYESLSFIVPPGGVTLEVGATIQGQGSAVPEPATLLLFALGGLMLARRRR
ncbi:MAG: PEP-CTERM sorting domain-containing protein, partial [Planctomycetes bacterium]|nr:PEP-CTERM sorting domain-containing protein [Planctomycetota bacterium]